MKEELNELQDLMSKIDKAMEMTEGYKKEIEDMKKDDSAEHKISRKEDDKKEFDGMTVEALKRAYVDIEKMKKREIDGFKKELDSKNKEQEGRRERLAKYVQEFTKANAEEKELLGKRIAMLEARIKEGDKEIQTFLKNFGDTQAELDANKKKVIDYSKALGAEEVVVNQKIEENSRTGSEGEGTREGSEGEGTRGGSEGEGTRGGSEGEGTRTGSEGEGTRDGSEGEGTRGGSEGEGTRGGSEGEGTREGSEGEGTRGGSESEGTREGSDEEGREGAGEEAEEPEVELTEQEQLRLDEQKMLKDFTHITSITYSAKTNSYIIIGKDKDGNEKTGDVKALDRKERKGIKKQMSAEIKGLRGKADPNIYRILDAVTTIEDWQDISARRYSHDLLEYSRAMFGGREMKDTKITYDFSEKATERIGLFAKLRAYLDARRNKEVATIIDKNGIAKLNGEEIKALPTENDYEARESQFKVAEYNHEAAIEAYKAYLNDPARNVKVRGTDGQEK